MAASMFPILCVSSFLNTAATAVFAQYLLEMYLVNTSECKGFSSQSVAVSENLKTNS